MTSEAPERIWLWYDGGRPFISKSFEPYPEDAVEYTRADLAAPGWQPIETAPKNTHIFCGHAEKKWVRFGICYAEAADRWYYSGTSERSQYSQVEGDAPTHWMPMLTPPAPRLGRRGE